MKIIDWNEKSCVELDFSRPSQMFLQGSSGCGKSVALEALACEFYKAGFTIIYICDPKLDGRLIEAGYHQFLPIKKWQLQELKKQGKKPESIPVIIHHPYTENLPTSKKVPEMDIYTLDITQLGNAEVEFFLETNKDKITRNIMIEAISNLNDDDNSHDFLHKCEKEVLEKSVYLGEQTFKKRDKNNYYLLSPKKGTSVNFDRIQREFSRFKKHYFFQEHNFKLNIDYKKIILDQKHIHLFSDKYIQKDMKCKQLITLSNLKGIIEANTELKRPILIIFEELDKYIVNSRDEDYKYILGNHILHYLTTIRANRMFSITTFQSPGTLRREVIDKNIFQYGFIGKGGRDVGELQKLYGFDKEIRQKIIALENGEFLLMGFPQEEYQMDDLQTYRSLTPTTCHSEPEFVFEKMFKKYYPDRMESYEELVKEMKEKFKLAEKKYKEQDKKEQEQHKKRQEMKKKARDEEFKKKLALEKAKSGQEQDKKGVSEIRDNRIIELHKEGLSTRKIVDKLEIEGINISQSWVNKKVLEYESNKRILELEDSVKQ